MKTIGLLGGMSWESTQTYYRLINQGVRQALGGNHSAQIALYSVDFAPIETLQHRGDWPAMAGQLIQAAQRIEAAGADCLVIATNTMHKLAAEIEAAISIPLLHIADAAASMLKQQGVEQAGLLGTAFTMEQDFYRLRLQQRHGIEVITPDSADRARVHQVIYEELIKGQLNDASRQQYLRIIDQLAAAGAQAVILGCTEIGLLVEQKDTKVRLLDTTAQHAAMAVEFALGNIRA